MHEIELKFCVPSFNQAALSKQIDTRAASRQRLSAYYFDTPDQQLANHGIALRIRYENEQWVQTLKTSGDGLAKRIELNHTLALTDTPETIDLALLTPDLNLIDHAAVTDELNAIMPIDQLNQALTIQYLTDIERTQRLIKKNNSRIELAYDLGKVALGQTATQTNEELTSTKANSQASDKEQINDAPQNYPVHEIEFELLDGTPEDLIDVAKTWCKRYKLYLSTVTKAQRGNLLMAHQRYANPVKADLSQLHLHKSISKFEFMQQVINNCLIQILPNATAIAEGSPDGNHVHQLRVGIRRLRTVLKVFKQCADNIDPTWLTVLKQTFTLLGEFRDKEILQTKTQPMLEEQGAPHVAWSIQVPIMPIDAVRANDFQIVLLELIAFTYLPAPDDSDRAKPYLRKRLNKLFNHIAAASDNFVNLDTDSQHGIRKDLKTLRYMSEFAAPLFVKPVKSSSKKAKKSAKSGKKMTELDAFLQYLEPAQDILGAYNDTVVGHANYIEKAQTDPNALFAVGWFAGRERYSAEACASSLKTVKYAPKFW